MAPKKVPTPIKGTCSYCGEHHASSSKHCPMRNFSIRPVEAFCVHVAEQYMKIARLILKAMNDGRAHPTFIDDAIGQAYGVMLEKVTEWRKKRDTELPKHPYVPPAVDEKGGAADKLAELFIAQKAAAAPATPKDKKKHKEPEPEEESEEASDGEEEKSEDEED